MKRGTIAVLIILSVFILSAAALFASSWLMGEKTSDVEKAPDFVANFEIKEREGLFRCKYKDGQEVYQVYWSDNRGRFGGAINYYTADGKLAYMSNTSDVTDLTLEGQATSCIFTIYNQDGSKTQEDCDKKATGMVCDTEPIYKK